MPPQNLPRPPLFDARNQAAPSGTPQKSSAGPLVGTIIIIVLLVIAALYFWGAHLNAQSNPNNQLPLIPPDNTTAPVQSQTTQPQTP